MKKKKMNVRKRLKGMISWTNIAFAMELPIVMYYFVKLSIQFSPQESFNQWAREMDWEGISIIYHEIYDTHGRFTMEVSFQDE